MATLCEIHRNLVGLWVNHKGFPQRAIEMTQQSPLALTVRV
ncbi:MAG: hypothetical protein V7746_18485 [Halioglobus sp.]